MDNFTQEQAKEKSDFMFLQMDFSFLPKNMQNKSVYAIAAKCYSFFLLVNDYDLNYEYRNANPTTLTNLYDPKIVAVDDSFFDVVKQDFVNLCKKNPTLFFHLNNSETKELHIFNDGKIYFDEANDYARKVWRKIDGSKNPSEQYLNEDSILRQNEFIEKSTIYQFEQQWQENPDPKNYTDYERNNFLHLVMRYAETDFYEKLTSVILAGVDTEALNLYSKSALEYCKRNDDKEAIQSHIEEIKLLFDEKQRLENGIQGNLAKSKIKI
jgi:hypothetical protein